MPRLPQRGRPRSVSRAAPAVVVLLSAGALTSACGGSGSTAPAHALTGSATATAPSATTTPAPTRHRARPPRPSGAPLGSTRPVRAGGSRLLVTIGPVLDPLTGAGAALAPGMRAVGVVVAIHNTGGGTYDSTASGDVSLATTAGPAAPLFIRTGRCATPLADFESLIGAGETRSGCVGFSVGRLARVKGVRFSPHSRAPGSVSWR